MNFYEIKIVRRKLDDYQDFSRLKDQADQKIKELSDSLIDMGTPSCPNSGHDKVQNHVEMSTRFNKVLSEQQEWQDRKNFYGYYMQRIELFLKENFCGEVMELFVGRYLEGKTYEDMESITGLSSSGIKNAIYRALSKVDSKQAETLGVYFN